MKRTFHVSPSGRSIWRHRDLRVALAARAVSFTGDALALVALTLRVHDAGAGTRGVALLMVAFMVPTVLAMGVAGRVADRHDSRTVLLLATLSQVLACAGLALAGTLWVTYGCVVALQVGQAFANPTWGALLPRIVGDEAMGRVAAVQQALLALTGVAGAALAGLVVGGWGVAAALWLDCVSFGALLVAAAVVRTRRGGRRAGTPRGERRPRAGALEGLRVLRRDRLMWLVFGYSLPFIVLLEGVNVVEVFLIRDSLHATSSGFGIVQAVFCAGSVAGAWWGGRAEDDAARVRLVVLGLAGTAAGVVAAGVAPTTGVLGGCFLVLGVFNAANNAAQGPLFAVRAPEADRGLVLAAVGGVSRTASVVALGLGGLLGSVCGPRVTFVAGGALALLVVLGMARALRGVDRQVPTGVVKLSEGLPK